MRRVAPTTSGAASRWSRWVESSTLRPTRLGGFRALKKTPEAPYTIKVNYRKCTSRGTTLTMVPETVEGGQATAVSVQSHTLPGGSVSVQR